MNKIHTLLVNGWVSFLPKLLGSSIYLKMSQPQTHAIQFNEKSLCALWEENKNHKILTTTFPKQCWTKTWGQEGDEYVVQYWRFGIIDKRDYKFIIMTMYTL